METRTWMWIAVIFIHKNQTLGTTQTPVSWTDQLNVVYPFNGLLLSHEKNHLLFNLRDGWLPPKYDPSERSQTQHSIWSHWHEFLGQTNLVYVEVSQKVARDMGECSGWWVGSVFCFWWRLLHRHIQLSNLINRTPCTLIYDTLIKKYIKNALFSEFWSKFYSRLARRRTWGSGRRSDVSRVTHVAVAEAGFRPGFPNFTPSPLNAHVRACGKNMKRVCTQHSPCSENIVCVCFKFHGKVHTSYNEFSPSRQTHVISTQMNKQNIPEAFHVPSQ